MAVTLFPLGGAGLSAREPRSPLFAKDFRPMAVAVMAMLPLKESWA
jgi:hypothetical protein